MRLSAPVHQLKRKARLLSRKEDIPLHKALDRIAAGEGFRRWSLLTAKASASMPAGELYTRLGPGDLVLVGARPGQGKTLLGLRLALEAMKAGNPAAFFTLEYGVRDVLDRLAAIGADHLQFGTLFHFDDSDAVSADHVIARLASAPRGALAVVDYLQLLDQSRDKPELMVQVRALKTFAREQGLTIVFLSQIDRSYDPSAKAFPDLDDVRLPNPLDLTLFDKACFLNGGEVRFRTVA